MSKKDKKAKDKHSSNGSKKHDKSEGSAMTLIPQTVSLVPPEDQFSVNKKTYEKELARLQKELIKLQEWIRYQESEGGGHLRGTGCGRQGGRDQTDHRKPQPARLPCGGAAGSDRTGKNSVVLPALYSPSARRRRDGSVRPQLV